MLLGVREIPLNIFSDHRGNFLKILSLELMNLDSKIEVREVYYSRSSRGVIRGFHLQEPPYDGYKLIHLISGSIHDVLLDARPQSSTFGKIQSFELNTS